VTSAKPLKTALELQDIVVEQACTLYGPWPKGMTVFVFDDAYGWSASIRRPLSEADSSYRSRAFDLIKTLKSKYDLNAHRLSGLDDPR
jgi:hypothetical protein